MSRTISKSSSRLSRASAKATSKKSKSSSAKKASASGEVGKSASAGRAAKQDLEARKEARKSSKSERSAFQSKKEPAESCYHCSSVLESDERALFVEEEVGRIFCSEECISSFFAPDVERLEKEYLKQLSSSDLDGDEKEKLAHLRWITLEEPDEIWREKTLTGDFRFTLISEFKPGNRPIWCVCICLFLRGEPSFLYMAFPTKNAAMANFYRRGERVQWAKPPRENRVDAQQKPGDFQSDDPVANGQVLLTPSGPRLIDGLADSWTEDETRRAQMVGNRRRDDIPAEEYEQYQSCMEQTLEEPDEVWTLQLDEEERKTSEDPLDQLRLFHFVRQYPNGKSNYWYVIVARETEDEDEIEILDAFPTRDSDLVENYRRGTQEVGVGEEVSAQTRMVH